MEEPKFSDWSYMAPASSEVLGRESSSKALIVRNIGVAAGMSSRSEVMLSSSAAVALPLRLFGIVDCWAWFRAVENASSN